MKIFTEHPASVGENYFQHLGVALSFAAQLLGCGLACLIHAVFPFLFVKTGSRTITQLYERMVANRGRHSQASAARASNGPSHQ